MKKAREFGISLKRSIAHNARRSEQFKEEETYDRFRTRENNNPQ
ncbi:hypothetical protein [Dactylococcopsis salina]|nr:hypothetical protein [Dactylococcopsis salina]